MLDVNIFLGLDCLRGKYQWLGKLWDSADSLKPAVKHCKWLKFLAGETADCWNYMM